MDWVEINGRTIELTIGDITAVTVDAIVNAANSSLAGGGGVDGAIHRAGGPAIMAELRSRYGPDRHCATGSAVVTGAGLLPARWVIHAVGPIWRGGASGEEELLNSAYRTSLHLAAELGARTIAMPAISTGIYGYPLEEGARVAIQATGECLASETSIERVVFVVRPNLLSAFQSALAAVAG